MKQKDVKSGESYLFFTTFVEHRKNMLNTVVTVCGRKSGSYKEAIYNSSGKSKRNKRFLLTNGQYCNASEIKPIN